ncbi:MAG: LysM peptidoglycan-binding domain-containing protein [Bacteroidales bacterium]|nr:LysM peptidoglycan-binding domain-containing protein [Bacteroidales bacterium]
MTMPVSPAGRRRRASRIACLTALALTVLCPFGRLAAAERPSARQQLAACQASWQLTVDRQHRRDLQHTVRVDRDRMLALLALPRTWAGWLPADSLPAGFELLPLLLADGKTTSHSRYTAGLWGLTEAVALKYGLRITANYDERLDEQRATRAAVRYWRDLQRLYDSPWQALLALVNTPPVFQNAARRLSSQQFWDFRDRSLLLYDDFPGQWASLLYWSAYGHVQPAVSPDTVRALTETTLGAPLSLSLLCRQLALSESDFRRQNPCVLSDDCLDAGSRIWLDKERTARFVVEQERLYAQTDEQLRQNREARRKAFEAAMAPLTYTVRSGDTLGAIARRYQVRLADLMRWNQLKSDRIYVGQKLKIHKS